MLKIKPLEFTIELRRNTLWGDDYDCTYVVEAELDAEGRYEVMRPPEMRYCRCEWHDEGKERAYSIITAMMLADAEHERWLMQFLEEDQC